MITKLTKSLIFVCLFLLINVQEILAQCAMCRTTMENNVSQGEGMSLGAGLNTGILLLFFAPYVVISVIGYLWYKKSKENAAKIRVSRPFNP